jgi:hypothetical protein
MSDKREIGEAVLKMYFIAKTEKIPDIDVHTILETFTNDWVNRGVSWCRQRKYLLDSGITRRGIRYIKGRITKDEYPELRDTMVNVLIKGAKDKEIEA